MPQHFALLRKKALEGDLILLYELPARLHPFPQGIIPCNRPQEGLDHPILIPRGSLTTDKPLPIRGIAYYTHTYGASAAPGFQDERVRKGLWISQRLRKQHSRDQRKTQLSESIVKRLLILTEMYGEGTAYQNPAPLGFQARSDLGQHRQLRVRPRDQEVHPLLQADPLEHLAIGWFTCKGESIPHIAFVQAL